MAALAAYLQQLRGGLNELTICEPEVDDKELGVDDATKFREEEDLKGGAVLKGVLEPGTGTATPQEGDLVFLHFSLLDEHRQVLCSTSLERGASGRPQPFVIGRGRRMLRGMELGVLEMLQGERAMLDIKPGYAFLHKDSGMSLPQGLRREAPVVVDVTLTSWCPGSQVKCVGPDADVFLRTLRQGQGWETPRPPFEVSLHIDARTTCVSEPQGAGDSYFSSTNSKPLTCSLGTGQLPPGVEAAVQSMQRQQEALVYCPTSQLCGGKLVPDPPDGGDGGLSAAATCYAEVVLHLLDFSQVRDMTSDGGVVKRTVRPGRGEFPVDCPLEDSLVRVHYRVRAVGEEQWLADSRGTDGQAAPVQLATGMGEAPEALDMSVRLMLCGEVAVVTSTWRYAYEGRQDAPQGLTPGGGVEFEVELVGFEQEASHHAMSGTDKLERAGRLKTQGNALFKQGKSRLARTKYQKALKLLGGGLDLETEEEFSAASSTRAACMLNIGRCAEHEREWGEALTWCNKAISEDEAYAKAYFRRAVVSACLGEYEAAQNDLAVCAELEPSTAEECERELRRMQQQQAAAEAKQRDTLKGFFNR